MDKFVRARNLGFETAATSKMLRDTYTLLATTLIPTAIGAGLSSAFGWHTLFRNGIMGFIITFAIMMGLTFCVEKNKDNKLGLALLYVFTFFLGILLAGTLGRVLSMPNGGGVVAMAMIGTMTIFGACAAASSMFKVDLAAWGKVLLVAGIATILACVAVLVFNLSALVVALLILILVISSAFLFYELSRIKQGEQTSPVSATLSIYLDLYNIFTSLLQLLGIVGSDD